MSEFTKVEKDLDYIPLNKDTIKAGMRFGPIEFKIKSESHQKHLNYLKKENKELIYHFERDFLFPFEMFALPRILSVKYKKLNEILSVRCERTIYELPNPEELLMAETLVDSVFERNGLCFASFITKILTKKKKLLMSSVDKALLINGSDINKVRATILREKSSDLHSFTQDDFIGNFTLGFRFNWDESVWINNIHTDRYAKYVGFEKGLIEAPAFVDILFSNAKVGFLLKNRIKIYWQYYKPLYKGLKVSLFLSKSMNNENILFITTLNLDVVMKITVIDL